MIDVTLRSKRLLLTTLKATDAAEVLEWINNPDILSNFQFFTGRIGVEDERLYIANMNASSIDILLGLFVEKAELIGTCGLHEIDFKNDTARLGIIVGEKERWNEGYATEAIRTLLDFAFNAMNLHKIYLNVFITNEKAIHLYRSVGFRREGTLIGEYKIRGEHVDMYRMAILREQWQT